MSKRIVLTDNDLSIIRKAIEHILKQEKYHIDNSILGTLGRDECVMLLEKLEKK